MVNILKAVIPLIIAMPAVAHPALLGVRAEPTRPEVQKVYAAHIPAGTGLTVWDITPQTAAAHHLHRGDVLLRADGKPLHSPADLAAIVQNKTAGETLRLELLRHGEKMELGIVLDARNAQPALNKEQTSEINRLLLLLVPHGQGTVDIPAVRRHLLKLADAGLAEKDEYATCVLHMRHGEYMLRIKSTERVLSVLSNHPDVPDAVLRADFYKRDTTRLPEQLEQLLLNAEYYRP